LHRQGFAATPVDRDGSLTEDLPHNGHTSPVRPLPGARLAVDHLVGPFDVGQVCPDDQFCGPSRFRSARDALLKKVTS
jgi:hypothetical protein